MRSIQDEANLQQHHPLGRYGTCSGRIEHGLADIAASTRRCVAKASPVERRTVAALRTGRGAPRDAIVRAGHIEGGPLAAVPALEIICAHGHWYRAVPGGVGGV